MPLRFDNPEEVIRAKNTLTAALRAQLTLLHGSFPLMGWLLLKRRDADATVLAAQGAWNKDASSDAIAGLMQGDWAVHPLHTGFEYRELDGSDLQHSDKPLWTTPNPASAVVRRPLRDPEGTILAWLLGLIAEHDSAAGVRPEPDPELAAQAIASMALSLTQHAHFEHAFQQLVEAKKNAFIEPLTRVLNRAGWVNRVQHIESIAERSREDVAIVMLDLDFLKLVNDRDGHSAGDELLQLTAQTIKSVVRDSDVVGRLGGDEFGLAVCGVTQSGAEVLVQRLRAALDEVGVNVSMGMAMKSECGDMKETFTLADRRMYENKRSRPMPEHAMQWRRGLVRKSRELPDISL